MDETPPPTKEANGAYVHKRRTDPPGDRREHTRWYDSTRVHITIGGMVLTAIAGAFGVGFGLHDWLRGIEDAPIQIEHLRLDQDSLEQAILVEHNRMWSAINANRTDVVDLKETLDQMFCYTFVEEPDERRRCVNEQTRRRIRAMIQQGGTP